MSAQAIITRPQPLRASYLPPGALVDGVAIIDWLSEAPRYGQVPDQHDRDHAESTYWVVDAAEPVGSTPGGREAVLIHTLNAGTWCVPGSLPVIVHGRMEEDHEDPRAAAAA